MINWIPRTLPIVVISFLPLACSTTKQDLHAVQQENLGRGIVVGSTSEQQKQQAVFTSWPPSQTLKGQVLKLEGGAYVVRDIQGAEIRLPIDQYTTIDRPAHVGDWIEAYLDQWGRALQVRNVDEEMKFGEE